MRSLLLSNRKAFVWLAILLTSLLGCAAVPVPDAAGKFMDDTFMFNQQRAAIFNGAGTVNQYRDALLKEGGLQS